MWCWLGKELQITPRTLFVSSQYLFNLKTLGQVRVVAPLLYCDGHSEPFRSLVETISLNFLQDLDGYSESFEPEMSIFARQAVWLRELLTEARAAKPNPDLSQGLQVKQILRGDKES